MSLNPPKAFLFDFDGTLAADLSVPTKEMIEVLHNIALKIPIGIISGASLHRLRVSLMDFLAQELYRNVILFPHNSIEAYLHDGQQWRQHYSHGLTDSENDQIKYHAQRALVATGVADGTPIVGEQFHPGPMFGLSVIGSSTPKEIKDAWDPDRKKRVKIIKHFYEYAPQIFAFAQANYGGRTCVDFMRKGIDKSHGARWFAAHHNLDEREIMYFGDSFYPGGNDERVATTNMQIYKVAGPNETFEYLSNILKKQFFVN